MPASGANPPPTTPTSAATLAPPAPVLLKTSASPTAYPVPASSTINPSTSPKDTASIAAVAASFPAELPVGI